MSQKVYLAVDTSYERGLLVVFSKNGVLFQVEMPKKYDHGKEICGAIKKGLDFLEANNLKLSALFCGIGPGSFVGIRIALSTLLGFSMALDLPLMGFCSHQALLLDKQDCFIFMKASGEQGYLSGYKNGQQTLPFQVVALADIEKYMSKNASLLTDQAEKIPGFLNIKKILGPNASGVFLACLPLLDKIIDEKSFIKPNYVKPPSVSVPTKILESV